jgi:hypothetical protein
MIIKQFKTLYFLTITYTKYLSSMYEDSTLPMGLIKHGNTTTQRIKFSTLYNTQEI